MNIHEFQAKQLLGRFGVPVPKGQPASTPEEAAAAFRALGQPKAVIKAQIHAGGRGKAGGVKLISSAEEARDFAARLLGKPLVTHQTGPEGRVVRRVYVEEASQVARELYLGMVVDRKVAAVGVIASTEGGTEIEEVAANTPERIITDPIDPLLGMAPFQARRIAFALGLKDKQVGQFAALLASLYRAFVESDASLIEINPLVVTADGRVICLDAKISFDDNGLFRHPDIRELRDSNEEDPAETEAAKYDLSYVHLDGNIGCMVNGAGLAMATMDIVKYYGAEPAKLSRCRRRRQRAEDRGRVSHPALRLARQGGADQRLRRHHAMRRAGARRGRRGPRGQAQHPAGGPHGRDQRQRGQADPRRVGHQGDRRQRHGRRGAPRGRVDRQIGH